MEREANTALWIMWHLRCVAVKSGLGRESLFPDNSIRGPHDVWRHKSVSWSAYLLLNIMWVFTNFQLLRKKLTWASSTYSYWEESHAVLQKKIIFTKSAVVSFSAVEVVLLRVRGIMRINEDCSVALQFKYSGLVSESTISTIDSINDSESSTTEGICTNILPFKIPAIRTMYVAKALENAGTLWWYRVLLSRWYQGLSPNSNVNISHTKAVISDNRCWKGGGSSRHICPQPLVTPLPEITPAVPLLGSSPTALQKSGCVIRTAALAAWSNPAGFAGERVRSAQVVCSRLNWEGATAECCWQIGETFCTDRLTVAWRCCRCCLWQTEINNSSCKESLSAWVKPEALQKQRLTCLKSTKLTFKAM